MLVVLLSLPLPLPLPPPLPLLGFVFVAGTDEYGMPQALEPRLTFAIDPQLPPREKKPFEAEAGKVKISARYTKFQHAESTAITANLFSFSLFSLSCFSLSCFSFSCFPFSCFPSSLCPSFPLQSGHAHGLDGGRADLSPCHANTRRHRHRRHPPPLPIDANLFRSRVQRKILPT